MKLNNLDNQINFRTHERSDIKYRVKWLNDPEVNKYIGDNQESTTVQKQKEWFDRYEVDESKKFFTILFDEEPIGIVGLSHIDYAAKEAKLFIMIGETKYQSRGIGKKATLFIIDYGFKTINLKKIIAEAYPENINAIKCYHSVGFNEESKNKDNKMLTLIISKKHFLPSVDII